MRTSGVASSSQPKQEDKSTLQRGITFSNPLGHQKNDIMSKSFMNKVPCQTDI
jgi:hypothetical protein